MQILDVATLKLGTSFPEPLFHKSGRKLLAARTVVTQLHIDALLRSGITQVFVATSTAEVLEHVKDRLTTVAVADLAVGMTAESDLMTPDGVVIVQLNEQVEEHHLAALRDSGVRYLFAKPPADAEAVRRQVEALAGVGTAKLDALVRRGEYLRLPEARASFQAEMSREPGAALSPDAAAVARRRFSARLQPVYGLLVTGKSPDHAILEKIAGDLMDLMRAEPARALQLAMAPPQREDYLPDHAVSVAVLSMAVAAHLGAAREMVKEIVLGALLFDVGMLMVPKRIWQGGDVLAEPDRRRVRAHPLFSVSMMEQITGLSPIPRLIGYQHHERLNGNGYPVGVRGDGVSDFARVVGAADAFVAAASTRAYKAGKLPYNAMEELVIMAHKGLLDPRVVKAFLAAVGLFPVGSYVALSTGETAQVVAANPARVDRPAVRPVTGPDGPVIDLGEPAHAHVKVAKAVPAPELVGAGQTSGQLCPSG